MKTVGQFLRKARLKRKKSLDQLEEETKIRKDFLVAIERGRWDELPDFPVVTGFVKSLAGKLGLDREKAVARLRRDYPPKKVSANPKLDVKLGFRWSPRLTFILGVVGIVLIVLGYLGFQYTKFVRPPVLELMEPAEGQVVRELSLKVVGKTNESASVLVNDQPVILGDSGEFETEIEILPETTEVSVSSRSRAGRETKIVRKIRVELVE